MAQELAMCLLNIRYVSWNRISEFFCVYMCVLVSVTRVFDMVRERDACNNIMSASVQFGSPYQWPKDFIYIPLLVHITKVYICSFGFFFGLRSLVTSYLSYNIISLHRPSLKLGFCVNQSGLQ